MIIGVVLAGGCDPFDEGGAPDDGGAGWFSDRTAVSGIDFVHTTGATGEFYFPEIAGSGCGVIDYDGDGDLDIYAVQAYSLGAQRSAGAGINRLYRNDLEMVDGRSRLRFTDVTDRAGVGDSGYGMGVTVGDYDNDGDPDLFVTNFGPDVLYRNEGDGTFIDVSVKALPAQDDR